jgi:1-acyl-sn-glycerol-3-phosphate acyltransferase
MGMGRKGPRFDPWTARCFESVFLPMRNLLLGDLHVLNLPGALPPGRPVLLVGNHISNWDGFLFREVQRRLAPAWPIYSVMLEEELRHRPIFRRLGGIGIDPRSPASVAGSVRAVRALRGQGPDFFLSFFPQGRVSPAAKRPLGFLGGVDLFVRALAPATILPVGIHLEAMRKLRPSMFVSVGRPFKIDKPSALHAILEGLVQNELDRIQSLLLQWDADGTVPTTATPAAGAPRSTPVGAEAGGRSA